MYYLYVTSDTISKYRKLLIKCKHVYEHQTLNILVILTTELRRMKTHAYIKIHQEHFNDADFEKYDEYITYAKLRVCISDFDRKL